VGLPAGLKGIVIEYDHITSDRGSVYELSCFAMERMSDSQIQPHRRFSRQDHNVAFSSLFDSGSEILGQGRQFGCFCIKGRQIDDAHSPTPGMSDERITTS
jgi:hypothetical protein